MAAERYYSPKDIMAILSVSKTQALKIMHGFEQRGQMYRLGDKLLRVKATDFDAWMQSCVGKGWQTR